MRQSFKIRHEFVEFIPRERQPGVIYISIPFATAVHSCFCGCDTKVVTPISPAGWQLLYDGESVSIYPSVGNWGFSCRSHYWIRRGWVVWAGNMSPAEIEAGRAHDRALREAHFGSPEAEQPKDSAPAPRRVRKKAWWKRIVPSD
jgi:hypothetical protein